MKFFVLTGVVLQLWGVAQAQTMPLPAPTPSNLPPVDYLSAQWAPAADGNFDPQNRPLSGKIDRIILHDIEGPASAGINIFQRKGADVSAHYVVGGEGGVWQMVREHNVAWHAGNRDINHRSVGIEVESYAYRPGWYGTKTYETAAKLVRDISQRYGIARDRTHIIGHAEVPNPRDPTKLGGVSGHTDPGPYWNWTTFMTLVRNDARLRETLIPATIRPGETLPASVKFENTGDDPWPVNTARNPQIALQATAPLVVLGTQNSRSSPLFNRQGWLSPTVAASPASGGISPADTLPGTSARFEFTLRGPRELGPWSDQLRLTTMPTALQGAAPVSFGDTVEVATRVVPWVIDVPSPDAPEKVSTLSPSIAAPSVARWSVALPLGGIYAVYAAPPRLAEARRQKAFRYHFDTLDGAKTVLARPEDGGKGWLFAGYYSFAEPLKGTPTTAVELHSAPVGVDTSNAGAVRFIGPFPAATATPPQLSQIPGALPGSKP